MNDAVAATAFRRLIKPLQHRTDVQNVDLMGLAGFCRNCLADWIAEADGTLSRAKAREIVHGMSYDEWNSAPQAETTQEPHQTLTQNVAKNAGNHYTASTPIH